MKAHYHLAAFAIDCGYDVGLYYCDEELLEPNNKVDEVKEGMETLDEFSLRIFQDGNLISSAYVVSDMGEYASVADYQKNDFMVKWLDALHTHKRKVWSVIKVQCLLTVADYCRWIELEACHKELLDSAEVMARKLNYECGDDAHMIAETINDHLVETPWELDSLPPLLYQIYRHRDLILKSGS
ncbi:hypothetical protein [Grimontia sp. SpTr1]|uniref:hypothetical protein n=1 Tax=Grimontia sp. SpTr1 TaxID=2995319 RepID=UPI00248B4C76|nr:hypothetical protein [Grimontia sp. SpTr1]